MEYEPYKMDSFIELLQKAYNAGWYGGIYELITVKVECGFEHNLRNRSSEGWDTIFIVEVPDLTNDHGSLIFKKDIQRAETLEEACRKILDNQPCKQ